MANEWNKTAFVVEFEAMLRRRLRSGAAPVAACAGFDLDAASAYLEGALGGSQRTRYESHLAGCATCRRHLIELSRLAQTVPRAGTQPATVMDQTPAWVRCRELVAGWFDLSTWNLKWQMAGVAGVAFAILIAALSAPSWRRPSNQADIVTTPSATPAALAALGDQSLQSLTSESSPQDAVISDTGNLIAAHRGQSQVPVPTPPIGPKEGAPGGADAPSRELPALSVNESSEPPVTAKPGIAEAMQNLPSQPSTSKESVQGPRIIPSPRYNPMNSAPPELDLRHRTLALVEDRVPQLGKPQERLIMESLPEKIKRYVFRLSKSSFNSESERKAKPHKQEASEDESPKPMLIPIRDKLFRFEKDMLIDVKYEPERDEWNVWTLKRGSELYKQVLADEPLLKEFFDRAPILIVWKNNRVYKVPK